MNRIKSFVINYKCDDFTLGKTYLTFDLDMKEEKVRELFKKEINKPISNLYTFIFSNENICKDLYDNYKHEFI